MGPYAVKGNQWVGYDDTDIVKRKASPPQQSTDMHSLQLYRRFLFNFCSKVRLLEIRCCVTPFLTIYKNFQAEYVNEKGLGGIMFWSIDNDDFRGKCHNRPYPLIEAAKEALLGLKSGLVKKKKRFPNSS